jgi:hypothetical protein
VAPIRRLQSGDKAALGHVYITYECLKEIAGKAGGIEMGPAALAIQRGDIQ